MKKILFIANTDRHIKLCHIPYLKIFKDNKYIVHVATNTNEIIDYCDKKININITRKPFSFKNIKGLFILKKLIKKEEYSIISCHTPVGGFLGRMCTIGLKNKPVVIYTAHGFHFYKKSKIINWILYYPIEKFLSRFTDCIITINQEDYDIAKGKFKAKHIELINGIGVDENKFNFGMTEKEKYELRKSLGLEKDDFVIIYPARLDKNKNQIFLINCMEKLVNKSNKIHLLLVGKDELNGYYQSITIQKKLEKNIHFLGYRNDVNCLFKISNLMVSVSLREGLPVSIIEAMICNLPVIATNCRGNRDLVEEGINGYIVPINDVKRLQEKILYYINNKFCLKNNVDKYTKNVIKEKMKIIYHNISNINIIHLLSSNTFSGAENVVCQIIRMFKGEKYKMIYCSPEGTIRKKLENEKIQYLGLNKMNYKSVKKIISEFKPDIIHAHDIKASIIASMFSKECCIISHIHGNHDKMKKISLKSILYCLFSNKFKRIFWVSKSAMNEYFFAKRVTKKSKLLVNVIDKKQINSKLEKDDNIYNYDIIYLGRLSFEKDPLRVYNIMKNVVLNNNKIKGVFVGDGYLKKELEENIIQDRMNKNIFLKGNMENPMKILKSSKVVIMASRYEGTPMCALEAMSLGIPIVATPTDGLVNIVNNEYNGFLSSKNEELVLKIEQIIYDDEYRRKLSMNCINKFKEINNLEEYKKVLEKEYI